MAAHTRKPRGAVVVARPRHHADPVRGDRVAALLPYALYLAALFAVVCAIVLLGAGAGAFRLAGVGVIGAATLLGALLAGRGLLLPSWREARERGGWVRSGNAGLSRSFRALAAQLTPIAVLALVFPLVGPELHQYSIGGTPLSTVVLAGSVAVPLLAQVACAPLYRTLGEDTYHEGPWVLVPSFLARWPSVFVASLPLAVVLAAPFAVAAHWSAGALVLFVLFGICSLAMVQWFVVPIMERRYSLWATAWLAYAAALLEVPRLVLVPPLVALLVLTLSTLWRSGPFRLRATSGVLRDFLQGSTLGTLIWLNPLLLLIITGSSFDARAVFLSLLPAVLLFNVYFTMVAPGVQEGFESFQQALHGAPVVRMLTRADYLGAQVRGKFVALGASLGIASAVSLGVLSADAPPQARYFGAIALCSIGFCLEAVFVHDLVQLKRTTLALRLSAVHCLAFAVAMFWWSPTTEFYTVNVGVEVALVAFLVFLYVREVAEPEYALFWGHALAW